MPLTSAEALTAVDKLRKVGESLVAMLAPDPDGKVRLTRAELAEVGRELVGALFAVLVDLVD